MVIVPPGVDWAGRALNLSGKLAKLSGKVKNTVKIVCAGAPPGLVESENLQGGCSTYIIKKLGSGFQDALNRIGLSDNGFDAINNLLVENSALASKVFSWLADNPGLYDNFAKVWKEAFDGLGLSTTQISMLLDDLASAGNELVNAIGSAPELLKGWTVLTTLSQAYRVDLGNIQIVSSFLKNNPEIDPAAIIAQFDNVNDPRKILDGLFAGVLRLYRKTDPADASLIDNIRLKYNAALSKNIGAARGQVGGETIYLESVSGGGAAGDVWSDFGNFVPTDPHYEGPLNYVNHTEQKIADYLWDKFKNNRNVAGSIEIISERPICTNCASILDQFQKDFKNISITRVDIKNL
jgi:hypothetical protein